MRRIRVLARIDNAYLDNELVWGASFLSLDAVTRARDMNLLSYYDVYCKGEWLTDPFYAKRMARKLKLTSFGRKKDAAFEHVGRMSAPVAKSNDFRQVAFLV